MTTKEWVSYYLGYPMTEMELAIYKELISLGYANAIDIARQILITLSWSK